MNRRYATQPTKTPTRTGGEDRPTPNCDNAWAPFEVLMHETRGPEFRAALAEARNVCGLALNEAGEVVTTPNVCPLLATCLVGSDEQWAKAILAAPKKAPTVRSNCGQPAGARRHYREGEELCEPCRVADRKATNDWRQAKREGRTGRTVEHERSILAARAAKTAARLATLQQIAANGGSVTDALGTLEISRDALKKWCSNNRVGDLYRELVSRERRAAA